jgi:ABC-type enterobactin transport system permease subunit
MIGGVFTASIFYMLGFYAHVCGCDSYTVILFAIGIIGYIRAVQQQYKLKKRIEKLEGVENESTQ